MKKILITGATGQLGNAIVTNLLKTIPPETIQVLVRDESKAADLKEKGVTIIVGNYHDKASLSKAMQGVGKVLLISSNDFNDRLGQHKNVVDAAKQEGVLHLFYTGVKMKDIEHSPLKPFLEDHYQTEDYIRQNRMAYTFLQNGLYADIIPMFAGENAVETGIFFPAGTGKISFAVRKDLAEAIAKILLSEGHENKTYPLSSANAYSFADVATCLSELSGKEVSYTSPEPEDFEAALKQIGLPPEIIGMSSAFAAAMKHNDFEETDNTLERILDRKQTQLKDYLKDAYKL